MSTIKLNVKLGEYGYVGRNGIAFVLTDEVLEKFKEELQYHPHLADMRVGQTAYTCADDMMRNDLEGSVAKLIDITWTRLANNTVIVNGDIEIDESNAHLVRTELSTAFAMRSIGNAHRSTQMNRQLLGGYDHSVAEVKRVIGWDIEDYSFPVYCQDDFPTKPQKEED